MQEPGVGVTAGDAEAVVAGDHRVLDTQQCLGVGLHPRNLGSGEKRIRSPGGRDRGSVFLRAVGSSVHLGKGKDQAAYRQG